LFLVNTKQRSNALNYGLFRDLIRYSYLYALQSVMQESAVTRPVHLSGRVTRNRNILLTNLPARLPNSPCNSAARGERQGKLISPWFVNCYYGRA